MSENMRRIPPEKFRFSQMDAKLHDKKFETKPIGYMRDAWMRFCKNKASLTAAIIILLIVLFAVVTPFVSRYDISDCDGVYAKARPKLFKNTGFWDGTTSQRLNDRYYYYYVGIGIASEDKDGTGKTWQEGLDSEWSPVRSVNSEEVSGRGKNATTYRDCTLDSYLTVGFRYLNMTKSDYDKLKAWQENTGIQVIYPMVDVYNSEYCDTYNQDDANFWYRHNGKSNPIGENGKALTLEQIEKGGLLDNYLRDENGNVMYYQSKDKNMLQVRVLYYNYYQYKNSYEPAFVLGADGKGYDILVRLANGVRLSLVLAICVAAINLTLGAIYGAIEGFYGGWADMIMERVSDVLNGVPFIIVATLFQLHLVNPGKVSTLVGLIFAFVLTGWIGTAYRVRTQFYRFKGQEYVLAARTLGAKDRRLMFRHIFPNALGTIITSSVLVIPGVIFTESTLSYLGIVNFNSSTITSLGTMLANGQDYLNTDPHIILFPSLIISLLEISFNLFGNGLRDAFNPSLRGSDE